MAEFDDEYYSTEYSESYEDSVDPQSVTEEIVARPSDLPNSKKMPYWNDKAFPLGCFGRGVVHIFNNYTFTSSNLDNFENGYADGRNVRNVFHSMSYRVRVWNNLKKSEIEEAFKKIAQSKGLSKECSLIIYVLSHGSDENTFFSKDGKPMDLMKLMVQFRKDKNPAMKLMPQIVFGDFCRGGNWQRGTGSEPKSSEIQSHGERENLKNMTYVMSSNPGMVSLMNSEEESAFTSVLCSMLSEKTWQKSTLDDYWFKELNIRLRRKRLPNTARYNFDPFPGPLFTRENPFSFRYDMKPLGKRVGLRHNPSRK